MKFLVQAYWLITPELESALRRHSIRDSAELLAAARTPHDRARLARAAGLPVAEVLRLAIRADLARVHGIGHDYAGLLAAAGVDRVQVLARCRAEELRLRLNEVNAQQALVRRVPSLAQVAGWIAEARRLPVVLE